MLLNDKKKMTSIIVAKMKESKPEDFVQKIGDKVEEKVKDMAKPESDYEQGLLSAASDIISAINAKDEKKLNIALKAHYDMCAMEESEEESEDVDTEELDEE